MNGAMAEPWARTSSDVTRASATTMGTSQNFFRSFIKSQNSFTNSNIVSSNRSKLMRHMRSRPRVASNPVCRGFPVKFAIHCVIAGQFHQQSHRSQQGEIKGAEDDSRVDPAEQVSCRHPYPVWITQGSGNKHSRKSEYHANHERPSGGREMPEYHRRKSDEDKTSGQNQTKRA